MTQEYVENGRYGIDIRGLSTHAEVNALEEILAVLEGHTGQVLVTDRATNVRILEGSVAEVRSQLIRSNGRLKEEIRALSEVDLARIQVESSQPFGSR